MAKAGRTELRSSAGKKLYAVRDQEGKFEDVQTYQRAHAQDMQRVSQDEMADKAAKAGKKPAAKKLSRNAAPKKVTAQKTAAKKSSPKKPATKKSASKKR